MPSRRPENYSRPTAKVEVPIQIPELSLDSLVRVTTQLKEAVERLQERTFGYVDAGGGKGESVEGMYLPLTGGTLTGTLDVTGQTLPISFSGPDASNVNVRWVNADGTERGSIYAVANNGAMVFRNRAGTGVTQSYLQLNPDQTALLTAAAGITASGVRINNTYLGNAGLLIEGSYPSIGFYDSNYGSPNDRFIISAGNGWMRIAVADATYGTFTDMLTLNPTAGNITAQLPLLGDGSGLSGVAKVAGNLNEIGAYAMVKNISSTTYNANAAIPAASLNVSNAAGTTGGATMSGTWRAMCPLAAGAVGLAQRIT